MGGFTVKAFHGKEETKAFYLDRVRAHAKADQLVKGTYWANGKGCAVGCTIHSGNHYDYETELGIPRSIARLEDGIFEGLPNDLAMTWPDRFLSAIKVGADLSLVTPTLMLWILADPDCGVIRHAKNKKTKSAIQTVIELYERKLRGNEPTREEWHKARSAAAYAAADSAAYAAYAYADSAAYADYASADSASADPATDDGPRNRSE